MEKSRKRNPYLITAACIALAAIALLSFMLHKTRQSEKYYKRQVSNSYSHAFTELISAANELDAALQKCLLAATGEMRGQMFTEVYAAAKTAKLALGELPRSAGTFDETSGFISQIGDYALALSKNPDAFSEKDTENLQKLSNTTGVLCGNLTGMLADLNDGNMTIQDIREITARASKSSDDLTADSFTSRIKAAEAEFPETPTLIYDGPFSSHIPAMKPKQTEGKSEVTVEEAKQKAAEFFGVTNLTFDGERGGNLPAYMFSCPAKLGTMNIEVSKIGDIIINMYSSHTPATASLSIDDAVKLAGEFISEKIPEPMVPSYFIAQDKSVTVNFAHSQDGVVCYPDLLKVDVSRENGAITGFEAQGYVMHHHKRELPEPAVSEEQARSVVSNRLKILSHTLAVIPTAGKNEVFCHEFKCEGTDGRHYIVYVNAETGAEQRILLLLEDENGTLTL